MYNNLNTGISDITGDTLSIEVDVADGKPLSPHTREFKAAAGAPYVDATILRGGKALALTGYDVRTDVSFRNSAWKLFKNL